MKKTIVELFAGVGGFRLGFEAADKTWKTVWANQWEPGAKNQHAYTCYKTHFESQGGINKFSNTDIHSVPAESIVDHTILVGGFPCQDYSVAGTQSKGIEGKKGVLWWDIDRILRAKRPPFVLLENVDRLIKSPAKQRGRDFAIILACLNNMGYYVEWRVVNAEEYGFQQRRRRTFIFAAHKSTKYAQKLRHTHNLQTDTLFARVLPIMPFNELLMKTTALPTDLLSISTNFAFIFENTGIMIDSQIETIKTKPINTLPSARKTLDDIMEIEAEDRFFLSPELYKKFVYMKGAKKEERTSSTGYKYFYTEGPIPFPDLTNRAARTILTSEGSNSRTTHIVKDKATGNLRKLTPVECERIDGFPDNWTNTGMPEKFRYFCMGNALVVDLIQVIATGITEIVNQED